MKHMILIAALLMVALPAHAKPLALRVHEAIEKVCPIDGVSLKNEKDKKSWRIDFKKEATPAEKQAARQTLNNFDVSAPDEEEAVKASAVTRLKNAAEGTDQAELFNALKDALKSGAIEIKQ
jgi:hypothetical protein